MSEKKPWTMMVYLAADNNLFTFGVDSLRQMKVAANESVNILAEFDTGPTRPAKRYFFDGKEPIGPIEHDLKQTFGPTDAADPDNLASFIEWGARNYPADHYFVVIWGHGGGVDDDFPRQPDNSFVPRHALLSLFKGTTSQFPKGTTSQFPKGTTSQFPKGTTSQFPKGTTSQFPKGTTSQFPKGTTSQFPKGTNPFGDSALGAFLKELLKAPLEEIGDILSIGDDALHRAVISALKDGVGHAIGEKVLSEIQKLDGVSKDKSCFPDGQRSRLEELRTEIL